MLTKHNYNEFIKGGRELDLKNILKKAGYTSIVTSIVLAIIGAVMFLYSEATIKVIGYGLGAFLIVTGVVKIIDYIIQKGSYDLFNYNLVYGIISIIFGLVIVTNTEALGGIIGLILGIWIIYSSLMRFGLALKLKAFESKSWIVTLMIAILMMMCGIYIIFVPDIIIATLGAILFLYSIMDIVEGISFVLNSNAA